MHSSHVIPTMRQRIEESLNIISFDTRYVILMYSHRPHTP